MILLKRSIVFFLLLFLVSCASHLTIKQINEHPIRYKDREVIIKGVVIETIAIPFVNKGIYKVDDNTGSIWVLSKNVPFRGEKVIVKGKVKNAFTINNRTLGTVIVELDKEIKDRKI